MLVRFSKECPRKIALSKNLQPPRITKRFLMIRNFAHRGLGRSLLLWSLPVILSFLMPSGLSGQETGMLTVTVKEGQHVRDIAQEYFNDANLWTEILRVNGLQSVTDIRPGMQLKIPVDIVTVAGKELKTSQETIQKATEAGARIFAPILVSDAIRLRDEALKKRSAGEWQSCIETARASNREAEAALAKSASNANRAAEAVLNDRKGTVQSRKSSDLIWNEARVFSTLVEQEKIRTLSQSFAEILFRDESRLRLNENSQAIVQKMRINLLDNKQEATVSLVEGDIYALLAGSPRKKVNVEIPGVTTKINSKQFWINHDEETTRFANYDGAIEVSTVGSTVTLQKNEGTSVSKDQRSMRVEKLLVSPNPIAPAHNGLVYQTDNLRNVVFQWEPVEGAASYWIEIAYDKSSFKKVAVSQRGIRNTQTVQKDLENGVYYWTVAAIDQYGFPGARSEAQLVKVVTDNKAPYLYLFSPRRNGYSKTSPLEIRGETEYDAALKINGQVVEVGSKGEFKAEITLTNGDNPITIEARDPAGNRSELLRFIQYVPHQDVAIAYESTSNEVAPNHYKAKGSGFTFSGHTEPDALVEVDAVTYPFQAKTFAEKRAGSFAVSVPLKEEKNEFDLAVTTPANFRSESRFTIDQDLIPPEISLNGELPGITESPSVQIEGSVTENAQLKLNGGSVEVDQGQFRVTHILQQGKNDILLQATDIAGNQTRIFHQILYDDQPPTLEEYSLTREQTSGGETVSVLLQVKDTSGLKRAAPFTLTIADYTYRDFLKWNRRTGEYQALVPIPDSVRGPLRVLVELEDYLGNKTEKTLEQS